MRIFIVENEPETRKEIADLLAGEKRFKVVGQAGSVREALAGMEATLPEAIILDISLADGSGVEILKHIRRQSWDIRVIVLTGNPYDGLRAACLALGATAVLDKHDGLIRASEVLLAQCCSRGIRHSDSSACCTKNGQTKLNATSTEESHRGWPGNGWSSTRLDSLRGGNSTLRRDEGKIFAARAGQIEANYECKYGIRSNSG
jgi:DNA-binding NarL/FixJ family response regulator